MQKTKILNALDSTIRPNVEGGYTRYEKWQLYNTSCLTSTIKTHFLYQNQLWILSIGQ